MVEVDLIMAEEAENLVEVVEVKNNKKTSSLLS